MTDDDPLDPIDDVVDDDIAAEVRGNGDQTNGDDADASANGADGDAGDELTDADDTNNTVARATGTARRGGTWLGSTLAMGVLLPPRIVLYGIEGAVRGFTRVVPGAQRIWKRVIKAGYNGLYKSSGADMINHVMKEGRLKPVPLTWNNDEKRFEGPNGEWWLAGGENEHTLLGPGNTPVAWAAAKSTNLGTKVQAEVAEALDLGYGTRVYTDAEVTFVTVQNDQAGAAGSQQAVTDGGGITQRMTVTNPGVLEDYVVPLDPLYQAEDGTEAAGRLVSMEKYYETYPETVDSEEMKKQEDRGRLAEQQRDMGSLVIKLMLLCALIIGIVVLGPDIVAYLFGNGGGGGGGGGGMPFLYLSMLGGV